MLKSIGGSSMFDKAIQYVKLLPKLIGVFGYAYMHPAVSIYLKATAMAGIVYFFSPMDIIPDIFAPVGLIDDVILALLIMQKFILYIPDDVLQPILDKFGISKKEMLFNVEEAVKETYSASSKLYYAIHEGYDSIIEYYSKKRLDKAQEILESKIDVSVQHTDIKEDDTTSDSSDVSLTVEPVNNQSGTQNAQW
jgi:uncharacterized membrane protein YkvA (DUF1232 family)